MKYKAIILITILTLQTKLFAVSGKDIKVYLIVVKDSISSSEFVNNEYRSYKTYTYRGYYQIESDKLHNYELKEINEKLRKAFSYKLLRNNNFSFHETHYPFALNESFPRDTAEKMGSFYKPNYLKMDSFYFQKFDSLQKIGKQQYIYKSAPLTFNTWQTIWHDNSLIQQAYETYNLYNVLDTNNAVKNQHFITIINDSILFISSEIQILYNFKNASFMRSASFIHLHHEIEKSKIGEYYAFLSKKMFDENIHLTQDSLKTFYHIDMYPSFQLFKVKKKDTKIENQCYFYYKADRMNNKRIKAGYKANLHEFCTLQLKFEEIKPFLNSNSIYFDVIKIFYSN